MADLNPEHRYLLAEMKLFVQEEVAGLREYVSTEIGELKTQVAVLQDRAPERPRAPLIAGASAGGLVAALAYLLQLLGLGGGAPPQPPG